MRTKHLLTKTLLAIAGLCVGENAWGQASVTETYDFATFVSGGLSPNPVGVTLGDEAHTHAKSGEKVKVVSNPTNTASTTLKLNGRIAVDVSRTNSASGFAWRTGAANDWQNGLMGQYQSNPPSTGYYGLSILDLKTDDEVTITWVKQSTKPNAAVKFATTNAKLKSSGTAVSADAEVTSGVTYVITSDGPLDVYTADNNFAYKSIVIVTTGSESIDSNPVVSVTGAHNGDRTITITSPKTNAGNNTKTYYTKDGTTPSSSSTLYNDAFTVTASDIIEGKVTIKAITYKDGDTSIKSGVSSIQLTDVGSTLPLNAPAIALTGFTLNGGVYNPIYSFTSDQSGVIGTPVATLSYSFAGGETASGSSYTPSVTGTLRVTASADGYTSTSTDLDVTCAQYYKSYTFDATSAISVNDGATPTYDSYEINSTGCRLYALGSCTFATDKSISFDSKMQFAWAITNNKAYCLFARTGASTVSYSLNAGEYIEFTNFGTPTISSSATTSTQLAWYTPVRQINVYTPLPATVVALANGQAKHLTFKNATSGSSTWENWLIALYGNGTKAAQVRADWWDDIAATNAGFTYGYTYSSDGGTTADNTNVWATFQTDMADADIDFTLSYTGGTFYVIGTMTKGTDVYYVNFSKSGLSGTVYYDLFGNNATLSNITTAATSVVTAPAHPTNVAVTMGSNGYTTYANNVYPLDLTSAPAYKAAVAGSKVNFTLFGQAVPANTGMLVKGTANGTVNLPIADASTAVAGNDFLVNASGATFEAAANTTYYAMIKNSDPLTFGTFAPGTLAFPANKAYLTVVTGGAPSLIAIFDGGQTTGIDAVKGSEFTFDGEYYNLAGQRVAQPTKGLYIVNGKKVVVK